ncbi:MAG: FecR family protein [Prochlorotrichaceae cyanobacterium]
MSSMFWGQRPVLLLSTLALLTGLVGSATLHAQTLRTPASQRWLEVRQVNGTVTYRSASSRAARTGDRFEKVGDRLTTGARSSAVLAIDDGIGFIQVSENTDLQIKKLQVQLGGGKITEIQVNRGQARLNVRRFTNPQSRLKINTPAGVAAVRGTEFGVTVDSQGRSGVTAASGIVDVEAQNQTVSITANQFSTIVPGQAPTPARSITRNLLLEVQSIIPQGNNEIIFQAVTDAPNLVFVNGQEALVDRNGIVTGVVATPVDKQLNIIVRNPLGEAQQYLYAVP